MVSLNDKTNFVESECNGTPGGNHGSSCGERKHLISVCLEDYFQVDAFERLIDPEQWPRFETRLQWNTHQTLELLAKHDVKATFFVLGWNAHRNPKLIREVAEAGHEIASAGVYHRSMDELTPDEFRFDLREARRMLEDAAEQPVLGYRVPSGWLRHDQLWALDILIEEGYVYDSSVMPRLRRFHSERWRSVVHQHTSDDGVIWEFPPSSLRLPGLSAPIAGGNYLRQFPYFVTRRAVDHWIATHDAPFMMYFCVWELDEDQPQITAAGPLAKMRHYRNLGKYRWMLDEYFSTYEFGPIIDYVRSETPAAIDQAMQRRDAVMATEIDTPSEVVQSESNSDGTARTSQQPASERTPVTIAIPCYNEERGLHYLANTIDHLEQHFATGYELSFVFIDDGSSDATANGLSELFGNRSNCQVVLHEKNQGVAAAMQTGLRSADTEIVCTIDCDCSYDPLVLGEMIPLLAEGVDLVTASPYHPDGAVKNVPEWRLVLSRGASFLYRHVLGQKLHTYTSCCRVHRKSSFAGIEISEKNFLGVAEMLGRLILRGGTVVEHPAVLSVRIFGQSKMKTLRTIFGHFGLLAKLGRDRFLPAGRHREQDSSTEHSKSDSAS